MASRSTSSARASRRGRTTSRPRSLRCPAQPPDRDFTYRRSNRPLLGAVMSPPDSAAATAAPLAPAAAAPAAAGRKPAYRRILLKLSGEALMGDDSYGIERATIDRIVAEIGDVVRLGVEVAVVIGGGNIFRGVAPGAAGMDRATADYMGM